MVNPARIGHTGITWPFTTEGALQAMDDVASLGYRGIELFGFVLDGYPGGVEGIRRDLERHHLRLTAAYCSATLIDPASRKADVKKMVAWAGKLKALGGEALVVGASVSQKAAFGVRDYGFMCGTLNEIGRRSLDLGINACFHPHTGTPVETRDQIDRVMNGVDPTAVFMAPDTGQIAKGGGDPLDVVRTYKDLIRHVHLKDWIGGISQFDEAGQLLDRTGYLDYVPLGQGIVDLPAIIQTLDEAGYGGWWMVELDGTQRAAHAPKEAAAISKRYLESLVSSASLIRE
jgi:inosose dehydratase